MSTGYLSRLESGARPPTARSVAYLAERLGVEVSAFEQPVLGPLAQVLATATSAPATEDHTDLLIEAIERDDGREPAARWQGLWMLTTVLNQQGDHAAELPLLCELTQLSDELAVPQLQVRARTRLARCQRGLGDVQSAWLAARGAVDIAHRNQLPQADTASALQVLISVEAESGRTAEVSAHVDELITLIQGAPDVVVAEALWTAAIVRLREGDHTAAEATLQAALDRLHSQDDLMLWARLRLAASAVALQMEPAKTEAARVWLTEADTVLTLVDTPLRRQELLSLQAHLAFHEGRWDDALKRCDQLDAMEVRLSYRDRIRMSVLRGRICILTGDVDAGMRALQELALEATDNKNMDLAAQIWRTLADALAVTRRTAHSENSS